MTSMLGKLLGRFLKPYKWYIVGVVAFQMASVIANLYLPTLNAQIIDEGVARGDINTIWARGGLMLAVSFLQIAASIAALFLAARAAMMLGRDIRNAVYTKVTDFSEREVNHFGPGSLITRNTNDVQQVQNVVMMGSTMLVMAPLMAIGGIIMALRQDVGLSWLIAVSVPILLVVAGLVMIRLIPLFRSYQEKLDGINRILREQLTGVRVVRAFVREKIETARFLVANTDIMVVGRNIGTTFVLLFPIVMLILNVTTAAVFWFGAIRVDNGQIEVGTIIAFMQYIAQVLFGVVMAAFMAMMFPRAVVSAERIEAVLSTKPSLSDPEDPKPQNIPGEIRFEGVAYSFPDAEEAVLSDISFLAKPGQTTAIVGSTASGKTTLIDLIPRLFDTTEGTVSVGGTPVRDQELSQLWASLGLVPKSPSCSPELSLPTSASARKTQRKKNCGQLWKQPRLQTLSERCPRDFTPTSHRVAPTFREANDSVCQLRGPLYANLPCLSSTILSLHSTSPQMRVFARPCGKSSQIQPRSSWPKGSPQSQKRNKSWCWTAAA